MISSQPGAGKTCKTQKPQPCLPGSNVELVKSNFLGCSPPVSRGREPGCFIRGKGTGAQRYHSIFCSRFDVGEAPQGENMESVLIAESSIQNTLIVDAAGGSAWQFKVCGKKCWQGRELSSCCQVCGSSLWLSGTDVNQTTSYKPFLINEAKSADLAWTDLVRQMLHTFIQRP